VVRENSEDVLVGSYVDEYCFDAPFDVVDVYSASVETQTTVDETERTLDDGTWLRRKLTSVVAYLGVDDDVGGSRHAADEPPTSSELPPSDLEAAGRHQQESKVDGELQQRELEPGVKYKPAEQISDAASTEEKPAAVETSLEGLPLNLLAAGQPDPETKTGGELQPGAIDVGFESKGVTQATKESVGKPAVDAVVQPSTEHVQQAQLDSGSVSLPTTTQSADSADLTCKVEPSSAVVETEPEYKVEHAVVASRDEQMAASVVTPEESSLTTKREETSVQFTETSGEPMPVAEELIMAVPNPRQERARPTMAAMPVTSSFDETEEFPVGEEFIEEQPTSEQFAAPPCDLEPVTEAPITPNLRPSPLESVKLDFRSQETASAPESLLERKKVEQAVSPTVTTKADETVVEAAPHLIAGVDEGEAAPVMEELIVAVPDPRQERPRPVMTSVPITSSFDEPEEPLPDEQSINEEHTAEQFATPVSDDIKPVEEDVISPEVRPSKDATKHAEKTPEQILTDQKPEALSKAATVECAADRPAVVPESTLAVEQSGLVQPETAPVTEELIVAVPDPRQERSRPVMASVLATSSFDEPEELIEESPTVEQFAAPPVSDLMPAEEDLIAPDVRPPRATAMLDSRIGASNSTPFVPVEKAKTPSETVQLQSTESRAPTAVDQQRTRPVLILRSESDSKTPASTCVPALPPTSFGRQPRRPHSASEMTRRRHGVESPEMHSSKPRMRRESPLSFVDRLASPTTPPLSLEDFDLDDGRRQVNSSLR